VRGQTLRWVEMSSRLPVFNSLVRSLDTVRKTMRIAYEAGDTWLVEILEQERESVAAQAAVALEEGKRSYIRSS